MSENQLTLTEEAPTPSTEPQNMLAIIGQLAANPDVDVEKVQRLLDMQREIVHDERRAEYASALATLQAKLKPFDKDTPVYDKHGKILYYYAKRDDIDVIIRPLMADHGFSFSWSEEEAAGSLRRFSGTLTHRSGYNETKFITLGLDTTGGKNVTQGGGSTSAYAGRYLLAQHLNIVFQGQDTDGADAVIPISEDQALTIETLLTDKKVDRIAFGVWLKAKTGSEAVADIPTTYYRDVVKMIEAKK